jgi:nitrite reductase (NADH) large subunit
MNVARYSSTREFAERVLGIDGTGDRAPFPTYTELSTKVPTPVWRVARGGGLVGYLVVTALMFVRPERGLFVFFHVIVPLWPLLVFVAPGLWRNVCPLAATNQLPRVLGFGRGRNLPGWLRNRGYLIAVTLFFGITSARLAGLDDRGTAMGLLLFMVVVLAFVGGIAFKGKSGWCSSICPLLPLQRLYGQTPMVTVPNGHCPTCVGCAKNCYDFQPRSAYQADLTDSDPRWSGQRKLFAAALPGFVLGFFLLAGRADQLGSQALVLLGVAMFISVGTFFAVEVTCALSTAMLAVAYAAAALNVFYWFNTPVLIDALAAIFAVDAPWLRWPFQSAVAGLTVLWIVRTRISELQFALAIGVRSEPIRLSLVPPRPTSPPTSTQVWFEPGGDPVSAEVGASLLDVAEKNAQPIEAGCRMGMCGADPIRVLEGMSNLSPPERAELDTLRRLGLGASTRLACCARVTEGAVRISMKPDSGASVCAPAVDYDRAITSVVVIGTGVAGVTAAEVIRRGHPDCDIHLVGQESHPPYNRMGIARLLYGRSAMHGLHLLPEQWHEQHGVTAWLNTVATRFDVRSQRVMLGTHEVLQYDRLILAMGASAAIPPIDGVSLPGSFVLRSADDAMKIRSYVQGRACRRAVVAGGGLLGLEAAFALQRLGLQVTVLERASRLLSRHFDAVSAQLVAEHIARNGIEVLSSAEVARVLGTPEVSAVVLKDGRTLTCELFLAAMGIRPNVELASAAGIPIGRGVLVDDAMRTQVPGVFAAGDVAEHRRSVHGSWQVATEQAKVAAANALGGAVTLAADPPATMLKGVGMELFSFGRVEAAATDEVFVSDQAPARSYRRILLSGERVVGATVVGHHPSDVAALRKLMHDRPVVSSSVRAALAAGDWNALTGN